ncbi:MAG TPA: SIS domain-containing protein [Candidatus Brocadiia bacterium]|nr:SIS domain-containing protein [Candidatus Brocadiia bacterium]
MTDDGAFLNGYLADLRGLLDKIKVDDVARLVDLCREAKRNGRRVFVFGNGGAAATASHFACDLGKGASLGRSKRFKVQCFNDCMPWFSAIGNDLSYEDVFVEQLENFAQPGDVAIGVSASGNSPNVIKAVKRAAAIGCETVGICGFKGGRLKDACKLCILLPAEGMGQIEDAQLVVLHMVAYALMRDETPAKVQ